MNLINKKPLISVIIPIYNVEKYLRKCLDSVLAQSYINLEIILIDDGSTDQCFEICDTYGKKDSRIKVVHKENGGISSARNIGLDMATGEYICFVDSDDYISVDMCEEMFFHINKEEADIAIAGISFDSGLRKADLCKSEYATYGNKELVKEYLLNSYINNVVWNKLYHKELLNGLRFMDIARHEDVIFTTQVLSKVKKAVYINQCFYTQYLREGSIERTLFGEKDLLILQAIDFRQNYVKKYYPEFYSLVEWDKVAEIYTLIKRMIFQGYYDKSYYNNLIEQLKNELKKDNNNDIRIKKYYMFLNYQKLYKVYFMVVGKIKVAKNLIKKIVIKLKADKNDRRK